jgi:hypothetical protein
MLAMMGKVRCQTGEIRDKILPSMSCKAIAGGEVKTEEVREKGA